MVEAKDKKYIASYASYQDLAEIIRHRFAEPTDTLHELYGRLVFNILCGNTDDHARNHAALWDDRQLQLTPAYDICLQARAGNEVSQAMLIDGGNRASRLAVCIDAAAHFLLDRDEAIARIERQIRIVRDNLEGLFDEADVGTIDRNLLSTRQFLNPSVFGDAPQTIVNLAQLNRRHG